MQKTLGGDRLGSGKKQKVSLHNYERSTHDLGYIWRSTMSVGTLVPFMSQLALPGDTFDIKLDCDIKTHPTVGPLFGSMKTQLDVFVCPIRLYNRQLHNNKLGIGLNMAAVKLPVLRLEAPDYDWDAIDTTKDLDNSQINPSCILSYLGIRGVGMSFDASTTRTRDFNALPLLSYWDIYKNYYANKQEEIGAVIHSSVTGVQQYTNDVVVTNSITSDTLPQNAATTIAVYLDATATVIVQTVAGTQDMSQVYVVTEGGLEIPVSEIGDLLYQSGNNYTFKYNQVKWGTKVALYWKYKAADQISAKQIAVVNFPLSDIDDMREDILGATNTVPFSVFNGKYPYYYLIEKSGNTYAKLQSQEGLGIKTYQSDLFNNWLQTEWIDGTDGISEVTAIDTSGGSFTIDTLNLSKKVYEMLNRIAVSGGTYDDWLDAVYTHDRYQRAESPIYMGGLIKELVFQEVVSNSQADGGENPGQPLGTLAGKGVMGKKHKGGEVTIKVDEPSYIIGIVSITPRIDYSQGNTWDVHLQTMDDLHKPALDEIGFQELITEQMAWWNTHQSALNSGTWVTKSAGKQPAWINYMTNVNRTYGNFAIKDNEMFMVLNRRYTPSWAEPSVDIDDLTTYIDPEKFNYMFADTALDSQNYWTQIAVDITARRKMSAKVMPNL